LRDDERIKDPRSTGRKRARALLLKLVEEGEREYACEYVGEDGSICGYKPSIPYTQKSRSGDILDANHKNKNWLDNDSANLEWLCRPHHYKKDRATEKGVSSVDDEFGYGI
jgi:hypothetical protein